LRIISGKNRGRVLHLPAKFNARPTTDFAKTGLFNILENNFDLKNIRVLDLFSGTGSIGLECASRGCKDVFLIEKDKIHFLFIKKTVEQLGFNEIHSLHGDVFRLVKTLNRAFDLIFADPPYKMAGMKEFPDQIFKNRLLAPGGWFVLEHSGILDFAGHPRFRNTRHYGNVHFSFFE